MRWIVEVLGFFFREKCSYCEHTYWCWKKFCPLCHS